MVHCGVLPKWAEWESVWCTPEGVVRYSSSVYLFMQSRNGTCWFPGDINLWRRKKGNGSWSFQMWWKWFLSQSRMGNGSWGTVLEMVHGAQRFVVGMMIGMMGYWIVGMIQGGDMAKRNCCDCSLGQKFYNKLGQQLSCPSVYVCKMELRIFLFVMLRLE